MAEHDSDAAGPSGSIEKAVSALEAIHDSATDSLPCRELGLR